MPAARVQWAVALRPGDEDVAPILADPAASNWIKVALVSALDRDPVDAANDAEVLARVLASRCQRILDGG